GSERKSAEGPTNLPGSCRRFLLRLGLRWHDLWLAAFSTCRNQTLIPGGGRMNAENGGPLLGGFVLFCTLMTFLSIAWYGFLLFYIGFKGGREIKAMTKAFGKRDETQQDD